LPSGSLKPTKRAPPLNVDLAGAPAVDELPAGGTNVLEDHLQALLRAGRHVGDAGWEPIGHAEPVRRELYEAHRLVYLLIVVGVEADLVDVEGFGPVDISHGDEDNLDSPVRCLDCVIRR